MSPLESPLDPWAYAPGTLTAAQLRKHKVKVPSLAPQEPILDGVPPEHHAAHREEFERRTAEAGEKERVTKLRADAAIAAAAALVDGLEDSKYAVQVQGDDSSVQVTVSRLVDAPRGAGKPGESTPASTRPRGK